MRRRLVAGNWKMMLSADEADALVAALRNDLPGSTASEVLVCPSFVYLKSAGAALSGSAIALGAQNLSDQVEGAYTGEVSAGMLKAMGCEYVIVGHSERRALYGESDDFVGRKFLAASEAGLKPILCIGETLDEHEAGDTNAVVRRQLEAVVRIAGIATFANAVLAYEPVWAIGTGKTATPQHAQDTHAYIRSVMAGHDAGIADGLRILYGGSCKPDNAADLFGMDDVDGGLIGGASLKAGSFLGIVAAAG